MENKNNNEIIDAHLLWASIGIILLGFIMVYSASLAIAQGSRMSNFQPYFFILRHGIYIILGIVAGFIVFNIDIKLIQKNALLLFSLSALSLVIVLIPGIGKEVNGAQRWLALGPINLQPSELMKIMCIMYAADYVTRKKELLDNLKLSFLPMLCVIMIIGFLLLQEPDFGAFIVISFLSFAILFLGGVNLTGFLFLSVLAIIGFVVIVITSPYRLARVVGFMNPWDDAFGKGYQLSHSLIAFGRGEVTGVGLGASVEKLFYLPEAHTDFLMAVIGEELGLIGVIFVVFLFSTVVFRAFKIGDQASLLNRDYESLVAKGMGLWFGFQSFINIGVNVGLLPTKGLTLPFMSFGGSSVVANFIGLAILMKIDYTNRKILKEKAAND